MQPHDAHPPNKKGAKKMSNQEAKLRESLRWHIAQYRGQVLTYEMVRKLMSFVFDMVTNDPGTAWISKDSHIRLLNGIFKRVGQSVDEKYVASLEDSIFSSLVINPPSEQNTSANRLSKPSQPASSELRPNPLLPASQPARPADIKNRTEEKNAADSAYQRVLLDLAIFENRIVRTMDAAAAEGREADKRLMEERIELEARLSREREELEAGFATERALQDARHAKERTDMVDWMNRLYAISAEQTQKSESMLSTRLAAIETAIASLKESSTNIVSEQSTKQENSTKEAVDRFNIQLDGMNRKLDMLEDKLASARKGRRIMTVLWVLSLAVTIAGFYVIIF